MELQGRGSRPDKRPHCIYDRLAAGTRNAARRHDTSTGYFSLPYLSRFSTHFHFLYAMFMPRLKAAFVRRKLKLWSATLSA